MTENQRIAAAAWAIAEDPRASRIEKLTALSLVASTRGLLIFDISEQWLSAKQITELRRIKQQLVERVLKKKQRKARQNRRAYLRRRLRQLETVQLATAPGTTVTGAQ